MYKHHVLYILGLNDQNKINKALSRLIPLFWRPYKVKVHVIGLYWNEGEFAPKLKRITNMIDKLVNQGKKVSLVGQSAGGSAALNAFYKRKESVLGVVNITGRVRSGEDVWPTLDHASRNSIAFKESVLLFEREIEPKLTEKGRERIMTIKPLWDETVPSTTVSVPGATNIKLPLIEHSLSGSIIATFYAKKIIEFLEDGNK